MSAAEEVQQRLLKFTAALEQSGVPYAVVGGNAVAAWVGSVDRKAIRVTRDVDILLNRADLERAKLALEPTGFFYNETLDVAVFLDGPQGSARDAVHVLFAGEKVRPDDIAANPTLADSEPKEQFRVMNLEALLRMKLTSFRRKDQVHILDLIGVGLIDASWVSRYPPELGARLQELLDDPNG
jgi:hypothetical protein